MTEEPQGMVSYNFEMPRASEITYADMIFKSFQAREVYVNGKQKGEYHVKPLDGRDPTKAVLFLKSRFPDCSVGLADPSGLLSLEYPIYLVCSSNPMVMEMVPQIFESIDEEMSAG